MKPVALILLASACLLLAGCPTNVSQSAAPPIPANAVVIGELQPTASIEDLQGELATRLAVSEINAAGGINGQPLALSIAYEGNNNPAVGVPAARDLVAQGVVAIVGASSSQVTLPVALQVTIPANIALVSPSSTSALITTLNDNNTVFRVAPSDALQGRLLAEQVWAEGRRQVAVFAEDEPYGQGLTQVFTQAFQQLGGTVTVAIATPVKQVANFSSAINRIYASGTPDALVMFSFPQQTDNLLREILGSGHTVLPALYGSDAALTADTLVNAPPAIVGLRGTLPAPNTSTTGYQHFVTAYTGAVGIAPPDYAANAYDAVYLIALAMAQGGTNTRASVLANLTGVSQSGAGSGRTVVGPGQFAAALAAIKTGHPVGYVGASGPINFDSHGDLSSATYAYETIVADASNHLQLKTLALVQP